jgi:general secretion pathway protein G
MLRRLFILNIKKWHHYGNRNGFTLIEVMICGAIIATLAAIAIPNYIGFRNRAIIAAAINDLKKIENIIIIYNANFGQFPETLAQVNLNHMKDPWGNPYQYLRIDGDDVKGKMRKDHSLVPVNSDFDLYSMGPDGKSQPPFTAKASRDDIVRAGDGGYLGKASEY